MRKETKKERIVRAKECLAGKGIKVSQNDIKSLIRLSNDLRKQFEIQCNGCDREKHKDESWEAYDKAREVQIEASELREDQLRLVIMQNCERLGLRYYFQTDPRGASLYVDSEEIPDNNYNRAICLY